MTSKEGYCFLQPVTFLQVNLTHRKKIKPFIAVDSKIFYKALFWYLFISTS